jgi:hypothetical protein
MAEEPEETAWTRLLGDPGDSGDGADAYSFATLELKEYPPPPDRDGAQSRYVRATGVVHFERPVVANVPAEVLPAFTRLRPDFPRLRHVALEIRYMIEEAAPGHSYTVVRLVVRTRTAGLSVEQLWPTGSASSAQTEGTTTTEFTSQVAGPVQVGLTRTRAVGTKQETALPPTVVDENRPDGFGWKFQEQPGSAIHAPRRGRGRALLALPRETRRLTGTLEAEVFTRVRRYGKFESVHSPAAQPSEPFELELGEPLDREA